MNVVFNSTALGVGAGSDPTVQVRLQIDLVTTVPLKKLRLFAAVQDNASLPGLRWQIETATVQAQIEVEAETPELMNSLTQGSLFVN
jgi:hypothetical protein